MGFVPSFGGKLQARRLVRGEIGVAGDSRYHIQDFMRNRETRAAPGAHCGYVTVPVTFLAIFPIEPDASGSHYGGLHKEIMRCEENDFTRLCTECKMPVRSHL